MRTQPRLIGPVLAAVLLLAACGGGEDSPSATAEPEDTAPTRQDECVGFVLAQYDIALRALRTGGGESGGLNRAATEYGQNSAEFETLRALLSNGALQQTYINEGVPAAVLEAQAEANRGCAAAK